MSNLLGNNRFCRLCCQSFFRYPIALNQTVLIDRPVGNPYWFKLTYATVKDRKPEVKVTNEIIIKKYIQLCHISQ